MDEGEQEIPSTVFQDMAYVPGPTPLQCYNKGFTYPGDEAIVKALLSSQ
jgi:hypothetical protein